MSLPKSIHRNLPTLLTQGKLLGQKLASELISNLEKDKPVNWNLVLNKQPQIENPKQDTPDATGN
jgi:hypothetical protein